MIDHEGELVLADVRQRILCFEYLPQVSLDKQTTGRIEWHIFGSSIHALRPFPVLHSGQVLSSHISEKITWCNI